MVSGVRPAIHLIVDCANGLMLASGLVNGISMGSTQEERRQLWTPLLERDGKIYACATPCSTL